MNKRIAVLPLLLMAAMLAACIPTPERYAEEMEPALQAYTAWSEGIVNVYHEMLGAACVTDSSVTYGDLIMGTVYSYRTGTNIHPSASWDARDVAIFQGTVQMMVDEGAEVRKLLEGITPPAAIRASHEKLVACTHYQVDVGSSMLEIFTDNTYTQLDYDSPQCEGVETALTEILRYIGE